MGKIERRRRPSDAIVLARLALVLLGGCAATAPSAGGATTPDVGRPAEMRVRIYLSPDGLGPLAPLVDPALDLEGRALVFPGGALPGHAAAVVVVDASGPGGANVPAAVRSPSDPSYAWAAESVHGEIRDGVLAVTYVHDVNTSGWCCSGIEMPDRADCDREPPLPPLTDAADQLVYLFSVPVEAARGVTVARTTTICVRA